MAAAEQSKTPSFILAIDTSLAAVSGCVMEIGKAEALCVETLPMTRGHAEALVPMVDRLVSRLPDGFASLGRVATTIGPGSFTGIRVGVAAARAIGLACKIPVVGISTLSALAAPAVALGRPSTVVAAIDAHHGNIYLQSFAADGSTHLAPTILSVPEAARALRPGPLRLIGSGAAMLAVEAWSQGINAEADDRALIADIAFVARLGQLSDPERSQARPLYIRPPDAKPQTNGVIERVS